MANWPRIIVLTLCSVIFQERVYPAIQFTYDLQIGVARLTLKPCELY